MTKQQAAINYLLMRIAGDGEYDDPVEESIDVVVAAGMNRDVIDAAVKAAEEYDKANWEHLRAWQAECGLPRGECKLPEKYYDLPLED